MNQIDQLYKDLYGSTNEDPQAAELALKSSAKEESLKDKGKLDNDLYNRLFGQIPVPPTTLPEAPTALLEAPRLDPTSREYQTVPLTDDFLLDPDGPVLNGEETRLTSILPGFYPDAPEKLEGNSAAGRFAGSPNIERQQYNAFETQFGRQPRDLEEFTSWERDTKRRAQEFLREGTPEGEDPQVQVRYTGEKDKRGVRDLTQVKNAAGGDLGEFISRRENNAGYTSAYNNQRKLRDMLDLEIIAKRAGERSRTGSEILKDTGSAIAGTAATGTLDLVIAGTKLAGASEETLKSLRETREDWEKYWEAAKSLPLDKQKEKYEAAWALRESDRDFRINKYLEQGMSQEEAERFNFFSDVGFAIEHFVRNPAMVLDKTAEVVGFLVPSAVGGGAAGLLVRSAMKALAKGAALTTAQQGAIATVQAQTGISIGALIEGATSAEELEKKFSRYSPDQLNETSELYRKHLAETGDKEKAKELTIADAYNTTFFGTAAAIYASGFVFNKFGLELDAVAGRALPLGRKGGANATKRLAPTLFGAVKEGAVTLGKKGLAESGQEGLIEEPFSQILENYLAREHLDPEQSLAEGVPRVMGEAIVTGGVSGGGMHAPSVIATEAVQRLRKAEGAFGPYADTITAAAQKYGVDPTILSGLIAQESGFDPKRIGDGGNSVGLGQFNVRGALADFGLTKEEVLEMSPEDQIDLTARFYAQKIKEAGGDPIKGLKWYNSKDPNKGDPNYVQNVQRRILEANRGGRFQQAKLSGFGTNNIKFNHPEQAKGLTSRTRTALENLGMDIVITSGHRTEEYNKRVGGAKHSKHIEGSAVDISLEGMDDATKTELMTRLAANGFTTFITYDNYGHLHADMREGKPRFMHNSTSNEVNKADPWFQAARQKITSGEIQPTAIGLNRVSAKGISSPSSARDQTEIISKEYERRTLNLSDNDIEEGVARSDPRTSDETRKSVNEAIDNNYVEYFTENREALVTLKEEVTKRVNALGERYDIAEANQDLEEIARIEAEDAKLKDYYQSAVIAAFASDVTAIKSEILGSEERTENKEFTPITVSQLRVLMEAANAGALDVEEIEELRQGLTLPQQKILELAAQRSNAIGRVAQEKLGEGVIYPDGTKKLGLVGHQKRIADLMQYALENDGLAAGKAAIAINQLNKFVDTQRSKANNSTNQLYQQEQDQLEAGLDKVVKTWNEVVLPKIRELREAKLKTLHPNDPAVKQYGPMDDFQPLERLKHLKPTEKQTASHGGPHVKTQVGTPTSLDQPLKPSVNQERIEALTNGVLKLGLDASVGEAEEAAKLLAADRNLRPSEALAQVRGEKSSKPQPEKPVESPEKPPKAAEEPSKPPVEETPTEALSEPVEVTQVDEDSKKKSSESENEKASESESTQKEATQPEEASKELEDFKKQLVAEIRYAVSERNKDSSTKNETAFVQTVVNRWRRTLGITAQIKVISEKIEGASGMLFVQGNTVQLYLRPEIIEALADVNSIEAERAYAAEVLAHEFGHAVEQLYFSNLPDTDKTKLNNAYEAWKASVVNKSGADKLSSRRGNTVGGILSDLSKEQGDTYTLSKNEWIADNVGRVLIGLELKITDKRVKLLFQQAAAYVRNLYKRIAKLVGISQPDAVVEELITRRIAFIKEENIARRRKKRESKSEQSATPTEESQQVSEETKSKEETISNNKIIISNIRNIKKLHNEGKGIYTLRVAKANELKGLDPVHHFGNPFGVNGVKGSAELSDQGTVEQVSDKFETWLRTGTIGVEVSEETQEKLYARREWILEQIDMGLFDNKPLLYFQDTSDNHAKRLLKIIEENISTEAQNEEVTTEQEVPEQTDPTDINEVLGYDAKKNVVKVKSALAANNALRDTLENLLINECV